MCVVTMEIWWGSHPIRLGVFRVEYGLVVFLMEEFDMEPALVVWTFDDNSRPHGGFKFLEFVENGNLHN